MNILPLIFAVLLILGLFSQTQMEQYKRFFVVKKQYTTYMKEKERSFFNERQGKLYNAPEKRERGETNTKIFHNRKLNARVILSKQFEGTMEREQHCLLLKELIKTLYQKDEKYQEIEQKRSSMLDELVAGLIEAAKEWGEVKDIEGLQKLQIADPELGELFYLMMQGTGPVETAKPPSPPEEEEDKEGDDEEEEGHFRDNSLKKFLHFRPNQTKIHVYLAHRPVLEAIFKDQNTVDAIIKTRLELYKRIQHVKEEYRAKEKEVATQELQKFSSQRKTGVNEAILDFQVTGTNPES